MLHETSASMPSSLGIQDWSTSISGGSEIRAESLKKVLWKNQNSLAIDLSFWNGKTYRELWGQSQRWQDFPLDCQQCKHKCPNGDETHLEWRQTFHWRLFHQRVKGYSAKKKSKNGKKLKNEIYFLDFIVQKKKSHAKQAHFL